MSRSRTQRLLKAQQVGAEIREARTNLPVRYAPRSRNDSRPWVVRSDGLDTDFRIAGTDCITRFPDESRCPSDATARTTGAGEENADVPRRWTPEQKGAVFGDSLRLS